MLLKKYCIVRMSFAGVYQIQVHHLGAGQEEAVVGWSERQENGGGEQDEDEARGVQGGDARPPDPVDPQDGVVRRTRVSHQLQTTVCLCLCA